VARAVPFRAAPARAVARRFATKEALAAEPGGGGGVWRSVKFWGAAGAIAGWGMTGAAIYDATRNGPEIISMPLTGVMIVYSSLFCRWAFVVKPANMLLASCHGRCGCCCCWQCCC